MMTSSRTLNANSVDVSTQSAVEQKSDTPLIKAISEMDVEKVKALLADGMNANERGAEGIPPLNIALRGVKYNDRTTDEKCFEVAALLLEHKADPHRILNKADFNLSTYALRMAMKAEIFESVKRLFPLAEKKDHIIHNAIGDRVIPWYANMIFDETDSFQRWTWKHDDWIKILKLLKAEGADLSIKSPFDNKKTLFTVFLDEFLISPKIYKKRFLWLKFILENGGKDMFHDPSTTHHVHFFFQRCVTDINMFKPVIDLCLKHGFDINAGDEYSNSSLLHIALINEYPNDYRYLVAARYLISQKADVNSANDKGRIPLHIAKSPEAVMTLLKAGSDVNKRDNDGFTPLAYRKKHGDGLFIIYAGNPGDYSSKEIDAANKEKRKRSDNFEKSCTLLANAMKVAEFESRKTNFTIFSADAKQTMSQEEKIAVKPRRP